MKTAKQKLLPIGNPAGIKSPLKKHWAVIRAAAKRGQKMSPSQISEDCASKQKQRSASGTNLRVSRRIFTSPVTGLKVAV